MQKHDRHALTRALALCRNESVGRAEQIYSKLRDEPWDEVAQFAAYVCQGRSLHLAPWESPPCWADADDSDPAAKLLRQMLDLGVSRWHPDPMEAIAEAKKRKAA
jgi:hypothetical protein